MKKIHNDSKNIIIRSDGGRYELRAKMKVDYDSNNDVFGAREWILFTIDLRTNKKVKLCKEGVEVFEKSYQYKKQLLKAISITNIFNNALSEINYQTKP